MKFSITLFCLALGTTAAFANESATQWTCQYDQSATEKLVAKKNKNLKIKDDGFQGYRVNDNLGEVRVTVDGTKSDAFALNDKQEWKSLSVVAAMEDEMEFTAEVARKHLKISYDGGYHFGSNGLNLDLNLVTGAAEISTWEEDSCNPVSSATLAIYNCKQ